MINRIKESIIFLGLSLKKELLVFSLINLLLLSLVVGLFLLKINVIISIVSLCFIPLIDYIYLSRYVDQVKKLKQLRNNELISLLSYFEIFISNHNNVYKSLELLKQYSSSWMEERLDELLKGIDLDKSVAPFITFSNHFDLLVIQNMMISIYQMVEQGESKEALAQFDYLFASINESLYLEKLELKNKRLDMLNAFPLIGAGLITILLTISIMSILGDIINVI